MESKKKKVKFGFDCLLNDKYEKLKEYIHVKYDYISKMGKMKHLGDRESYELDIQWRMICDISEFIDELELSDIKIKSHQKYEDPDV